MAQALAENLNTLGLPKRREWPEDPKNSCCQVRQSHLFQKEKEMRRLSRSLDCGVEEIQGEQEPHLVEKERVKAEHGEEKVDSTVKQGRFKGSE